MIAVAFIITGASCGAALCAYLWARISYNVVKDLRKQLADLRKQLAYHESLRLVIEHRWTEEGRMRIMRLLDANIVALDIIQKVNGPWDPELDTGLAAAGGGIYLVTVTGADLR